ncbi:hypothetical protein D3C81_372720 [compost metagenome]
MSASMKEAETRYSSIRQESYQLAEELFKLQFEDVAVTGITYQTADIADGWAHLPDDEFSIGWRWRDKLRLFRKRPRRVEVALWEGGELCGLALGKVTKGRLFATIHYLQGSPRSSSGLRGQVGRMVTDYLRIYATLCECKNIVIDSPIPELIEYYKKLGFVNEIRGARSVYRLWVPLEAM